MNVSLLTCGHVSAGGVERINQMGRSYVTGGQGTHREGERERSMMHSSSLLLAKKRLGCVAHPLNDLQ